MGSLLSYIKHCFKTCSHKRLQEFYDFEGMFLSVNIQRYYEDGYLEVSFFHNLYGKKENVTRCIQVENLDPIFIKDFINLLVFYGNKGMVLVNKDRGLFFVGKIFVNIKEKNSMQNKYVDVINLIKNKTELNTTKPTSGTNNENKEVELSEKKEINHEIDPEIVIITNNNNKLESFQIVERF